MTRRIPIVSSLVVLAAVAIMIALGFWQLQRKAEKEALLAQYGQALALRTDVPWPVKPADRARALYRHAAVTCARVSGIDAIAGRARDGRSGWAHVARCALANGGTADVALGWSEGLDSPAWKGGPVTGIIGPAGRNIRLIADVPPAGLAALAPPDPANVPNNHLSYAIQWFAFAATALVIYVLALRKPRRS